MAVAHARGVMQAGRRARPSLSCVPTSWRTESARARTAIGIQPADSGERFVQGRVGLHHLSLRARSREDIDRLHDLLRDMAATIIHAPQDGTWAPGCYSVLFEDPDGIRLEANFVPGAGLLAAGVKFNRAKVIKPDQPRKQCPPRSARLRVDAQAGDRSVWGSA
jgi:catechol 2,3-dioxygenase-like lactoylglutathione lyase family enzyme